MALSAEEREELGRLLERERAKLVRRLKRFGDDLSEVAEGGFSQHMAEHAAADAEREKAFLLAGEEGRRLVEVNRALYRLVHDPESFGRCRVCAGEVGFARLEALPYTELCIDCRTEEELSGRGSGG